MTDRLSFSNRSAPKRPGAGPGERTLSDYSALSQIEHWRRLMADEYSLPIDVDGQMFYSVNEATAVLGRDLRRKILRCKFNAWPLRSALLATGSAELWRSGAGGKEGVRDLDLERVRSEYRPDRGGTTA